MRIAVITVVAGRHHHLHQQQQGLAAGSRTPDDRIVVAIDDPGVEDVLRDDRIESVVVHQPAGGNGLPLAEARNAGAATALSRSAELLVFLDVDCIPGPRMLQRYAEAAETTDHRLLCGPVAYLPPPPPEGYRADHLSALADAHPGRPDPRDGVNVDTDDHTLFWSLSFAVTAHDWEQLGGFCENYTGYGGEDTDFGQLARRAGLGIRWVGGAIAYHQYHPVSDPPVEHLDDILRNAALFHRRWGWWPMTGWLTQFETAGLVVRRHGNWDRADL